MFQHDHDEELGMYWYPAEPSVRRQSASRPRDAAYWNETARLVLDYFELRAGRHFSEELFDGFIRWLRRSPNERRRYLQGDDVQRAMLVDWFLRVVLSPADDPPQSTRR
jgi:hypothetical protein